MTQDQRPVGKRFTQVYVEPSLAANDSSKLRNRVSAYFTKELYRYGGDVRSNILSEVGCSMRGTGYAGTDVSTFLKEAGLNDFLDSLTVIAQSVPSWDQTLRTAPRGAWIAFVNRAFSETNVSFELDDQAGVHPRIDAAFVANRQTTLRGLETDKFAAAREHFEEAYAALDGAEPRGGHAIREMHLAIETVFKQHFSKASRLDVGEINSLLKPCVVARLKGPELEAAKLMLTSAGSFISAGHQFRHANGEPEPAPPSMDVTVWMLSQGTAFLRWLVAFVEADAG